jgi:hypothetical protein
VLSTDKRLRYIGDMETQVITLSVNPHSTDSIESYGRPNATVDNIETDVVTPKPTQKAMNVEVLADNGLRCECSISVRVVIICYF